MKISYTALRKYISIDKTPDELSTILNMSGIEVESIFDAKSVYENFVIGRVLTTEKHPKADKLSVCIVDDGTTHRTIVCGASNVNANQTVAVALEGAIVPKGGFEISKRVLRGIESNGMICSKSELDLGEDDVDGIWVLDDSYVIGTPLALALGIDDIIFDISVTPNRADALSHYGIARHLSALLGIPIKPLSVIIEEGTSPIDLQVTIDTTDCSRYAARVVRNVTVAPSPLWLQQYLESVGLRPRNNIVDITNYVLMECGHPLHAFDASVITNNHIIVKHATKADSYTTLDGKERKLTNNMVMITDSTQNLAIAGVMGGENSSIQNSTKNVVIESAYFQPSSIRRTAKTLGISSDASYRFERGTDISIIDYAVNKAASMMQEIAGGIIDKGVVDIYPNVLAKKNITLRYSRVAAVLGIVIDNDTIRQYITRLQFEIVSEQAESIDISIPSYRVDIFSEIDVIEEIAILHTYNNIELPATLSLPIGIESTSDHTKHLAVRNTIRRTLKYNGFIEIVTQNQTEPRLAAMNHVKPVIITNPLGYELSSMRSSLLPSMLKVLAHNINNGTSSLQCYEIGKVFTSTGVMPATIETIIENEDICLALTGLSQQKEWYSQERKSDIFDLIGVTTKLCSALGFNIVCMQSETQNANEFFSSTVFDVCTNDEVQIGIGGSVSMSLLSNYAIEQEVFVVILSSDAIQRIQQKERIYIAPSLFPTSKRDIALLVDKNIMYHEILSTIRDAEKNILESVRLFDIYEGKGIPEDKKSMAFELVFRSATRTLLDADIENSMKSILLQLEEKHKAVLRG